MHRHIEPALKAWQAAWASNPHHSKHSPKSFSPAFSSTDRYSAPYRMHM